MMEKEMTTKEKMMKQTENEGLDAIVSEIKKRKNQYVISDKPFTVVKLVNPGYKEDYEPSTYIKADTYVPKENHPGVYDVYSREFDDGVEKKKGALNKEPLINQGMTWKDLKEAVRGRIQDQNDMLFSQSEAMNAKAKADLKEAGLDKLESFKRFFEFKKECMGKADDLLKKWELRDKTKEPLPLNAEEKMEEYNQKRFWRGEKNIFLNETELESQKEFTLHFITPDDNMVNEKAGKEGEVDEYEPIVPYKEVVVQGKDWEKSPLDAHVEVYNYTYHKEGYLDISKTTFEQGKEVKTEQLENTRLNVSWDELKHMAANDRLIHEAHVKANGKFFPPKVAQFKNDKEFEAFKAQCLEQERPEKTKEKRRGIHPAKKSNSKGMNM